MTNKLNPPTETELDWLDEFLLNRIDEDLDIGDRDEGIYDLSTLDGFFTAVVSGPELIPPALWIPSVWGDFEPEWESQQEAEQVLTLLIRYMNSVSAFLMKDPKNFEPLFMERDVDGEIFAIVDEWCEGYMRGANLIATQWQMESADMQMLLAPIKAFTMDEEDDVMHLTDLEIQHLQKSITPNVRTIHSYWLEKRLAPPSINSPFSHTEPRAGRNDPCPCGSGKKYKKCCLH